MVAPKSWADSAIAKMYPLGELHQIRKVTDNYYIEGKKHKSMDTLWKDVLR